MTTTTTIGEAREALAAARRGAAAKGKEVEVWLGSRYEELVESAEAIVKLCAAAEEVKGFRSEIRGIVKSLEEVPKAEVVAPPHRELSDVEVAARVVQRAPLIWRALDSNEHSEAARLCIECESAILGRVERATLDPYVREFRSRIVRRAEAFVRREPLGCCFSSARYANSLASVVALDGKSPREVMSLFFEARTAWIERICGGDETKTEGFGAAARHLRRTVIDAAAIFLDEKNLLEKSVRSIIASRPVAATTTTTTTTTTREVVIGRAVEWTRTAASKVRAAAAGALGQASASAESFKKLVDDIRSECDADALEFREASDLLFVEEAKPSQIREALGLKTPAATRRVFFDEGDHHNLHARLLEAAKRYDAAEEEEEDTSSPLWRSVFAPSLVSLVDERLQRGLEALKTDLSALLDAIDLALTGKTSMRLHNETKKNGADPEVRARLAIVERGEGIPLVDRKPSELNWAGERCADWLDDRLASLANDAASLGEMVLRRGGEEDEGAKVVVSEYVAPRFAEALAAVAAMLRCRAERYSKVLEDYARREDSRIESYCARVRAHRAVAFKTQEIPPGEARRLRLIAKTGVTPAATEEDHESLRAAKRAAGSLLATARVAWSAVNSTKQTAAFLASLCAVRRSTHPDLMRDARAVIDESQLRAAFDIADLDGDGIVAAAEAADAARAICVGPALEAKARALLSASEGTFTFEEFVLMATNCLDAEARERAERTSRDCFARAHLVAIQGWARAVGGAMVSHFADEIAAFATSWLEDDLVAEARLKRKPRKRSDWPAGSVELATAKKVARWRAREVEGDNNSTDLPCELTLELGSFIHHACDQLDRATCSSDAACGFGAPSRDVARRELHKVIAPAIEKAYADALGFAKGSDLAPLSLSIDAHFLRFAYRRAAIYDSYDQKQQQQPYRSAGIRIFETIASKMDAVDLELYGRYIKADAQRAYERSALFFNNLFGYDDASLSISFDDDFKAQENDDMPPDDFDDRPPNLIAFAPVHPRFPLVPTPPPLPDHLKGTKEGDRLLNEQAAALLTTYFEQHAPKYYDRFKEAIANLQPTDLSS